MKCLMHKAITVWRQGLNSVRSVPYHTLSVLNSEFNSKSIIFNFIRPTYMKQQKMMKLWHAEKVMKAPVSCMYLVCMGKLCT